MKQVKIYNCSNTNSIFSTDDYVKYEDYAELLAEYIKKIGKTKITVKSLITKEVRHGYYTSKELLNTDIERVFEDITACDCEPVGETYVIECNCCDLWEESEIYVDDELYLEWR